MLGNRPYLALIAVTTLLALPTDFMLAGLAVYLRQLDLGSVWTAGASTGLLTAGISVLSGVVVRRTTTWRRPTLMAVGGYCFVGWAVVSAAAIWLPGTWAAPWVLASALLATAGSLFFGARVNALAEAAPPASRGRHLAAFQYSFTAAALLAPLLVSSMALALWMPWALTGLAALLGAVVIPVAGRKLPPAAVRPIS